MVFEVVGRRSGGRKGRNAGVFGSSRSYERQLTGELTFEIRCIYVHAQIRRIIRI